MEEIYISHKFDSRTNLTLPASLPPTFLVDLKFGRGFKSGIAIT
jgi:hypothetical protein